MGTFKQKLTRKAEEYEKNFTIDEEVNEIKNKIEKNFTERRFTISLVKVLNGPVAIGRYMSSGTSLFFPQGMSPDRYIQMFIDEFKKLGFTDDDMTLSIVDYTNSVWYNIKLKW